MPIQEKVGTHQKALTINLDAAIFGSFAEIGRGSGSGPLVFDGGGASGTVAKTISPTTRKSATTSTAAVLATFRNLAWKP